ncbi:unnamed protein product [Scytosiphon promiscuus]
MDDLPDPVAAGPSHEIGLRAASRSGPGRDRCYPTPNERGRRSCALEWGGRGTPAQARVGTD